MNRRILDLFKILSWLISKSRVSILSILTKSLAKSLLYGSVLVPLFLQGAHG